VTWEGSTFETGSGDGMSEWVSTIKRPTRHNLAHSGGKSGDRNFGKLTWTKNSIKM